jgi:hyaluronan synthase
MILTDLILIYGFLSLTHLFMQVSFSHMYSLEKVSVVNSFSMPRVAIVIPEYNEDSDLLIRCIQSCLVQDYKNLVNIVLVDDGSKRKQAFQDIISKFSNKQKLSILETTKNIGKREAQKIAFDMVDKTTDIIVILDSDTVLMPDAVSNLAKHFDNKKVGLVTGYAGVINKKQNLLTRLIAARYWVAFNQERGAQSLFGTVLCATGVISAIRSSLIIQLKDKYVSQMFQGKKCTYGDDRHLTNLVLECGYNVLYEPDAIGLTEAPTHMKGYLKQQLRWNRSFYRELFYSLKMILKHPAKYPIYMIYDLIVQSILPFLLLGSMIYIAYASVYISTLYLWAYIGILIGISLLRGVYAISRTHDTNFLLFPIYSFIHIFLLIPLRLYAIFSLSAKGWGTR